MSKTYQDGLGRTVRSLATDMYGTRIRTVATLGWNDKPIYSYLPSGGYFAFAYDGTGRTISVQSPGDSTTSGTSTSVVSDKARMVESIDEVGRRMYQKTDVLGRTIETAVWNPATGAYGNLTSTKYNTLSRITENTDAKGQKTTNYYNSLGMPKMNVFPDGTYAVAYYDDNLRAFKTVDVMGRMSISTYDKLGRVTCIQYRSGTCTVGGPTYPVTYGYDPVHDDLLTIDNGTAKITRTYDGLHRLRTEKLDVPSTNPVFTGTVTYSYDNAGKVTSIAYPCSPSPCTSLAASYTHDSLGRPIQVDYGSKYAVLSYDSSGRLDNIHYWQGTKDTVLEEKYAYDVRDRVTQIKVYQYGLGVKYMQLDYVYNRASDVIQSTDDMFTSGGNSNPKTVTYSYDGNGRLWQAGGPFGASESQEYDCYSYDAVGNLLTWKVGTASCSTAYAYNYGPSPAWNRLDTFSYNTMQFEWNAAGSIACKTESGSKTRYTHDFQQQLTGIRTSSTSCSSTETPTYAYSYDGAGRRIKTYDGTTTSYFMYAGDKLLYSQVGTTGTAFVYVAGRVLFRKEGTTSTPEARYYHQDVSGNVRLISWYKLSNPSGINVDAKYRYKPFGEILTLTTPPPADPRFKFAHQELDASGLRLYHMGARYQDPVVMRFIERDPVGPGYGYAVNNPISFIDPSGMSTWLGELRLWSETRTGRTTIFLLTTIAAIALAIPSGGTSLALMIGAGLVVGAIFVAYTYVASGGRASFDDYYAAFALGFAIGVTIADVYNLFNAIGAARLAAAGAAAETRVAATAEAELGRGLLAEERGLASGERIAESAQVAADGGVEEGVQAAQRTVGGEQGLAAREPLRGQLAATSLRKFPEKPWETNLEQLVDAEGNIPEGGSRLQFQTQQGYRVEYNTGHLDHSMAPHYHVYGPRAVDSRGALRYGKIASFEPKDPIPEWLDF